MLNADESRYLTKVCRARTGESVVLTDGRGARAQAVLLETGQAVRAEITGLEQVKLERSATWIVGAPERGRADWMVEKLAELGVSEFQPVDTERAQWPSSEVRPERWARLARAALRQSRRCYELQVRATVRLEAALALPAVESARYVADPEGTVAGQLKPRPVGHTVGLVGPAGGLSPSERRQVTEAGYIPISLSDARLRTETAAMALASWWSGGA